MNTTEYTEPNGNTNESDVRTLALQAAQENNLPAEYLALFIEIYVREYHEFGKIKAEIDDWETSYKQAALDHITENPCSFF